MAWISLCMSHQGTVWSNITNYEVTLPWKRNHPTRTTMHKLWNDWKVLKVETTHRESWSLHYWAQSICRERLCRGSTRSEQWRWKRLVLNAPCCSPCRQTDRQTHQNVESYSMLPPEPDSVFLNDYCVTQTNLASVLIHQFLSSSWNRTPE